MPKPLTMKRAWLLTWTGIYSEKNVEQIAAILSARKSIRKVTEVVELLYLRSTCNAFNMAYYANRRPEAPFQAEAKDGVIQCGSKHHSLCARLVSDLEIRVDEASGKEIITWVESGTLSDPTSTFKRYERVYLSTISKDRYA